MTQATYAKFASEVSDIKEQVELEQIKDDLYYSGSINDLLGINSTYNNKLTMQEGELVYVSGNVSSREEKWFEQLGIGKSSDYYTVEFDTAGGTEIATQSIKIGRTAKKPKNPTKEGYNFLGWYYLEQGGTEDNPTYQEKEFDFGITITKDYFVYARYKGEAIITPYTENQSFWKYKSNITSIDFKKGNKSIPNTAVYFWENIEADSDCTQISAYLENDEIGFYKLTIISSNTIYANRNMNFFFANFSNLKNINFENFDTSKSISMYAMFYNCNNMLNLNLSDFVTTNVTNMDRMFFNCYKLDSLNINNFDTQNVKNMGLMFFSCSALESLNVSNFNTDNVENMNSMFYNCNNIINLNLYNWKTNNVKDMDNLFAACVKLTKIYVGPNWTTQNATTNNLKKDTTTFYYYSENVPIETGTYWHYVNNEITIW